MLTIQFVPHNEIQGLSSEQRIDKLLDIAKEEKIVLLEGKLRSHEEADLIAKTMASINKKFKGIELSVINPQDEKSKDILQKFREKFVNLILGNRRGFTIIGPATVVKKIKNDPEKIQLFTEDR